MADAKLTALTAASALAGADLFYVSQSAASRKATGTQLLTLVGTTYVPLAGGTMTGALTLPAITPALTFTGFAAHGIGFDANYGMNISDSTGVVFGTRVGVLALASTKSLAWTSGALSASPDVVLVRDAAATLAQRNSTTQQIFRLYNTYTDASNYERLTLTGVAGTSVNITAETLGTGADNIDIVLSPAGTGSVKFPSGASVDSSGVVTGAAFVTASAGYFGGVVIGHPSSDTAFLRGSAGQIDVTNGTANTYRDLKLRNLIQTEYSQMTEMTAPSAPAANSVRIYAEDNGSGKTRLMALFATGAAQQIAIEP